MYPSSARLQDVEERIDANHGVRRIGTRVPAVNAVGEPFGYAFINETTGLVEQHNLFRSADGHIHGCGSTSPTGGTTRMTALLPGVPPAIGEPFGYAFINETTGLVEQHNLFRSAMATSTRYGSTSPTGGTTRIAPRCCPASPQR